MVAVDLILLIEAYESLEVHCIPCRFPMANARCHAISRNILVFTLILLHITLLCAATGGRIVSLNQNVLYAATLFWHAADSISLLELCKTHRGGK